MPHPPAAPSHPDHASEQWPVAAVVAGHSGASAADSHGLHSRPVVRRATCNGLQCRPGHRPVKAGAGKISRNAARRDNHAPDAWMASSTAAIRRCLTAEMSPSARKPDAWAWPPPPKRAAILALRVELAEREELYKNPQHPYTQALISAIPIPDPNLERDRIILKGDVPSPINPPPGCRFNPRCRVALDVCRQEEPPFKEYSPGHFVACWLLEG